MVGIEDKIKLGIVGGSGNVGYELTTILSSNEYVRVIPIVRNFLSAGYLEQRNYSYRIGDITDPVDADDLLADLDVIIIAARTPFRFVEVNRDLEYNLNIIENTCKYADDNSKIIYFSSIAAFGRRLTGSAMEYFNPYVREKRRGEKIVFQHRPDTGFIFRLGHVMGDYQNWTNTLLNEIGDNERLIIKCDPDRNSNIIHIETLAEALTLCINGHVDPGRYTAVNFPQWTWGEVFEYYTSDDITLKFDEEYARGMVIFRSKRQYFFNLLSNFTRLQIFVPKFVKRALWARQQVHKMEQEIIDFKSKVDTTISLPILERAGLHETDIPGLTKTKKLV